MNVTDNDEAPMRVNPIIPNSIGALLAEEWTIDPQSTLPSFLEMVMIEEARRSGRKALKGFLEYLEHRLLQQQEQTEQGTTWSYNLRRKISRFVAEKILRPYGIEIRFVIFYLLERKSLQSSSSATISEALYGGKRVTLGSPVVVGASGGKNNGDQPQQRRSLLPMSKRDGLRLAFLVAVGPYLAERGDLFYRRLAEQNGNLSSTAAPLLLKLKKIFKVIYPFLHMSLQGIHLMHRWKYLLGQSVFFDPYSQWLNLVVRRLTTEDQATTSKDTNSTKSSDLQTASNKILENTSAVTESIVQNATLLKQAAMVLVSSALAVGWLARLRSARRELLRQNRLRVTQPPTTDPATTSNHASSSVLESMPPPPPPLPTLKSASRNNCLPSVCPLCRQPRVHPTASTGGYVFCLKCLLAYVKERAICPITGKDCPESSIVRLYEPRRT